MKRQLIQLSASTKVVSLPSAWVRKNNLRKGMELEVEEKDNRITVACEPQKKDAAIEINITGMGRELMFAYLDACYIAGYDSILVTAEDHAQRSQLSKAVRYFPGMMVYDEHGNHVQVKDITQQAHEDVDKILQRIFNMNLSLIEDCIAAGEKKEWEGLANAKRVDYNINSYTSYCLRMLNKYGYHSYQKTAIMHTYLKLIEMLSDKICDVLIASGQAKDTKGLKHLLSMYRELESMHNSFDLKRMQRFEVQRQHLQYPAVREVLHAIEELELQLHV